MNDIARSAAEAMPGKERKAGLFRRCWSFLATPSAKYSVLALVALGVFVGISFWGGFHTALEASNTMEFCVSCHEMKDTVYAEYKNTNHYTNRSGVRATCPDCHVPRDWIHKVPRKIQATGELYSSLMGTIDTPEKFEARRLVLAGNVWASMKATDSRECRNCHSMESMSKKYQTSTSWRRHKDALKSGETCIDCHKGVAHKLPPGVKNPDETTASPTAPELQSK
jgi:cytochrome c-type protein NapC